MYTSEKLSFDNYERSRTQNKYQPTEHIRNNRLRDKSKVGGGVGGEAGEGRHFVFSANQIKIVGALDFTHKSTSSNDALLKA